MCLLKDLDIRSRAAVALVEDWRTSQKAIRAIWKLDDLIELLLAAINAAHEVHDKILARDDAPFVDDEIRYDMKSMTAYLLESLHRLKAAVDGALQIVEMFNSQGYPINHSADLRKFASLFPELTCQIEEFTESLEWADLERTAMPSPRIRAVADYLKSTGQASA